MPNLFAYAALIAWPLVVLALFRTLTVRQAVIWSLLAGYLLLPVRTSFDFPGVPALDKTLVSNLAVFGCALAFAGTRIFRLPPQPLVRLLMGAFVVSPFLTAIGNGSPLILSYSTLPPMTMYDALSASAGQLLALLPFVLGYNLLSGASEHRAILIALVMGALIYSLPMLAEVRLSPQLHNWVYGFFPHDFGQQMRFSGFRPVVFLGHGLLVATFCAMALLATVGLARERVRIFGISAAVCAAWLAVVLILCKSVGAALFAAVFAPLLMAVKPRNAALAAGVLALALLAYPTLRGSGVFPSDALVSSAAVFGEERSESLEFRLKNEDMLLDKANERPWFGWGSWGRNRVYAEDYMRDKDVSVTDGTWIIIVGIYGWVGFLAAFGLLTYPLIASVADSRRRASVGHATATLMVVLVANLLDLIPNSSLSPLTWLIAGALILPRRSATATSTPSVQIPDPQHVIDRTA